MLLPYKKSIFDNTSHTANDMQEIVFVVEQEEDGSFVAEAHISDNEQIITEGNSIEELKLMIKDALECHYDNIEDMPKTVRLHFVKEEVFEI